MGIWSLYLGSIGFNSGQLPLFLGIKLSSISRVYQETLWKMLWQVSPNRLSILCLLVFSVMGGSILGQFSRDHLWIPVILPLNHPNQSWRFYLQKVQWLREGQFDWPKGFCRRFRTKEKRIAYCWDDRWWALNSSTLLLIFWTCRFLSAWLPLNHLHLGQFEHHCPNNWAV